MNDKELEKIKQAWQLATDDDVRRNLCNPHSVSPEVYAIIRAEAERRGQANFTANRLQGFIEEKTKATIICFLRKHLSDAVMLSGFGIEQKQLPMPMGPAACRHANRSKQV